jgi:hypothetical protein
MEEKLEDMWKDGLTNSESWDTDGLQYGLDDDKVKCLSMSAAGISMILKC